MLFFKTKNYIEMEKSNEFSFNDISLEYPYQCLLEATDEFSQKNRLAYGPHGSVYRGVLKEGTEVAIKVMNISNEAGFEMEVKVLSKFRHPNLVILIGFSRHKNTYLLIYEMLSGGDVSSRLLSGPYLSWQHRINIALDSACGLNYLYNSNPRVFHRDIKTANILLDRNGLAKMADFGSACVINNKDNQCKVHHTVGALGYADPQYIYSSIVHEKSEVYSFGMVLLELLTAKPPAVQNPDGSISYLVNFIGNCVSSATTLIDKKANFPIYFCQKLIKLALSCIQEPDMLRPDFSLIVKFLRSLSIEATSFSSKLNMQTQIYPFIANNYMPQNNNLNEILIESNTDASQVNLNINNKNGLNSSINNSYETFNSTLATPINTYYTNGNSKIQDYYFISYLLTESGLLLPFLHHPAISNLENLGIPQPCLTLESLSDKMKKVEISESHQNNLNVEFTDNLNNINKIEKLENQWPVNNLPKSKNEYFKSDNEVASAFQSYDIEAAHKLNTTIDSIPEKLFRNESFNNLQEKSALNMHHEKSLLSHKTNSFDSTNCSETGNNIFGNLELNCNYDKKNTAEYVNNEFIDMSNFISTKHPNTSISSASSTSNDYVYLQKDINIEIKSSMDICNLHSIPNSSSIGYATRPNYESFANNDIPIEHHCLPYNYLCNDIPHQCAQEIWVNGMVEDGFITYDNPILKLVTDFRNIEEE